MHMPRIAAVTLALALSALSACTRAPGNTPTPQRSSPGVEAAGYHLPYAVSGVEATPSEGGLITAAVALNGEEGVVSTPALEPYRRQRTSRGLGTCGPW